MQIPFAERAVRLLVLSAQGALACHAEVHGTKAGARPSHLSPSRRDL